MVAVSTLRYIFNHTTSVFLIISHFQAPELFTPKNAWIALENVKTLLLGPLGMKTLDAEDWGYNGYYDNDNDSTDPKLAHGFNYHQGPVYKSLRIIPSIPWKFHHFLYLIVLFFFQEWLWPVGFYLRARIHFAGILGNSNLVKEVLSECKSYLSNHYKHLKNSDWKGLPELTNKDAAFCSFSCSTQAWSMATVLEVRVILKIIINYPFRDLFIFFIYRP